MQAISRDQTEKEIFVVVGNGGCPAPAPTDAYWPVHAQGTRIEPFSRTEDKPGPTEVRRNRYVALARPICGAIPGPRGYRRWGRRERSAFRNGHSYGFTSSECCGLRGNWIDSLVFWRSIFQFLSKALVKLARQAGDKTGRTSRAGQVGQ